MKKIEVEAFYIDMDEDCLTPYDTQKDIKISQAKEYTTIVESDFFENDTLCIEFIDHDKKILKPNTKYKITIEKL